jgi:hypothetical protein
VAPPTGGNALKIGDFNGDGRPDLAVCNSNIDSVTILLGNGNGTFQAAVSYAAGASPRGLDVADFNGDGKADLVTSNVYSGSISVLLGQGDGSFRPAVSTPVGFAGLSLVAGEFNQDGNTDLALIAHDASPFPSVRVLPGKGDGTFLPASSRVWVKCTAMCSDMIVADLNADQRADLAFTGDPYHVAVLLGNGNGTFQPQRRADAGQRPWALDVADFNADGRADLVTANTPGIVAVVQGIGDGNFLPPVYQKVGPHFGYVSLAMGEFNGDGLVDIVVAHDHSNNLAVLLGAPTRRVSGDLDGNGKREVVWAHDVSAQAVAWYMDGAGGNQALNYAWLNPNWLPGWILKGVADFNFDGYADLVWMDNRTRQAVVWYMGGANGAERQSWAWLNDMWFLGWTLAAVADFNRDAVPDLVWLDETRRRATVWYMGGTGGAQRQAWTWISGPAGTDVPGWKIVAAADFNADGVPDLVWQQDVSGKAVVWYTSLHAETPFENVILSHFWEWLSEGWLPGWTIADAADFNGDRRTDLLLLNETTRQAVVWYMAGPGTNGAHTWAWVTQAGVPGWRVLAGR